LMKLTTCVNFFNILHKNFFVWKCFAHLFYSYILALKFFCAKVLAQMMLVKCWWNLPQLLLHKSFHRLFQSFNIHIIWCIFWNLVNAIFRNFIFWKFIIRIKKYSKNVNVLLLVRPYNYATYNAKIRENRNFKHIYLGNMILSLQT